MQPDDFKLTLADVCRRLGKSARTVHRYKAAGRLHCVSGASQGSPLYFSAREVEALAIEILPAAPPADAQFWERLDRVERLAGLIEQNPLLGQLLQLTHRSTQAADQLPTYEDLLAPLAALASHGEALDRRQLGELLVRLGQALQAP